MHPATDDARLADDERRAEEVYARLIRPVLQPEDEGKYVAVAVESGDFEIDADDYTATGRLLVRRPGARLWLMRTGPSAAYRLRGLGAARPSLRPEPFEPDGDLAPSTDRLGGERCPRSATSWF